MSQFWVEKRRAEAELTLATGGTLRGWFFLAHSCAAHAGPERIADLLNADGGFFPFETSADAPSGTVLINRAHVVMAKVLEPTDEARLDPGYTVAPERHVHVMLSNGTRLRGNVRVYRPAGHDRLSDYARSPEVFRYIENGDGTIVVNSAHIVELRESQENFW